MRCIISFVLIVFVKYEKPYNLPFPVFHNACRTVRVIDCIFQHVLRQAGIDLLLLTQLKCFKTSPVLFSVLANCDVIHIETPF